MNKSLEIYSHREFENVLHNMEVNDSNVDKFSEYAFVDIIGKGIDEDYEHYFKEPHENVINLEFDDVDKELEAYGSDRLYGISDEQAKDLISFIEKHKDKNFILCCIAGMSRSQAVGNYINQMYEGEFVSTTLLKHPNPYVLGKLKKFGMWKNLM